LESSDSSLIDIGCAEGYFVIKAASLGMHATGYDMNYTRMSEAQSRLSESPDLNFCLTEFTPENINELPPSDVILFLPSIIIGKSNMV
jgi:2-polyprenyl-3-methyl-5-hydroxy-6-metoxy-1,4-benzoquinol methylase